MLNRDRRNDAGLRPVLLRGLSLVRDGLVSEQVCARLRVAERACPTRAA